MGGVGGEGGRVPGRIGGPLVLAATTHLAVSPPCLEPLTTAQPQELISTGVSAQCKQHCRRRPLAAVF